MKSLSCSQDGISSLVPSCGQQSSVWLLWTSSLETGDMIELKQEHEAMSHRKIFRPTDIWRVLNGRVSFLLSKALMNPLLAGHILLGMFCCSQ